MGTIASGAGRDRLNTRTSSSPKVSTKSRPRSWRTAFHCSAAMYRSCSVGGSSSPPGPIVGMTRWPAPTATRRLRKGATLSFDWQLRLFFSERAIVARHKHTKGRWLMESGL